MRYIFVCYVIFWLVFKFVREPKARLAILAALSIVSLIAYNQGSGTKFEQSFTFFIGVAVYYLGFGRITKGRWAIAFLSFAAICLLVKQTGYIRTLVWPMQWLDLGIKTSALLGVLVISWNLYGRWAESLRKLRPLREIGLSSFELYLVHGYLFVLFDVIPQAWIAAVLLLLLAPILGWLVWKFDGLWQPKLKKAVGI